MSDHITAKVFRYDPDKDDTPYTKEYRVNANENMTVLVLLDRIHQELDETLSFRHYCCGLQMCKSCLMRINSKRKFACLTQVEPGDEIVIEPVTYPENHIKDLVSVDTADTDPDVEDD
jgi:succinate dehydrogenase/fumarate reductase-like Fe-S protein